MYFCIRDDDTNFFTSPAQLEQAYGEITNHGPVSLAVVPFHRAGTSKAIPEEFRGRWTVHPLHENTALVAYLRERVAAGRYEIMLHGYHHDEPDGKFEFAGGERLTKRVWEGKKYLEDLLNTKIRVFVAPHNAIRREGLRALALARLHFGGVAGVRSGWPLVSFRTWLLWQHLRRWTKSGGVGLPWILDLITHREIGGNSVTPSNSLQRNQSAFETALALQGVFCLATHYWELSAPSKHAGDPTVGEHLRYFVERAKSNPRIKWRSVGDTLIEASAVI